MPTFKCNIFSQGVQRGALDVSLEWAQTWDMFIARMSEKIYYGLEKWLGPFSKRYPVYPSIQLLPQSLREKGVNALYTKEDKGKVYLNLDMIPRAEEDINKVLPYCLGNLMHEFMHANLAEFIFRPPEGTEVVGWRGDSFYDEGYLDFMGEIVAADSELWSDWEFGEFTDKMFAGYVAMNNKRLQNALGISPGQEWSTPDFHIKRWAGQEYARKIGGLLFRRFMEAKAQKKYFYPVGAGPERNYDARTK